MKPAAFDYTAPLDLNSALHEKSQHGDDAKILAGGQSLIPAMNFRVSQPTMLIDLNKLDDLRYIKEENGELRIGAMTVQTQVEKSDLVKNNNPLLHETIPHIAHMQIRNRGTFGGNLAHADPASELPVVATALNARFHAQSAKSDRWLEAKEFFLGMFTTGLNPDEILTEISFPKFPDKTGWSFQEISRRHGDYAMAGVAVLVTLDSKGVCEMARLVYLNVGDGPVDAVQAAEILTGQELSPESIEEAVNTAAKNEITPFGNVHASPDYQKHLCKVLTRRAINTAVDRAKH
ncbi:MAG: xanthine dehydrogenase family protein subunit M [Anaerolineae bacterium]|nr:xanthine dehydrogenase family protein subunit M [Anaerolineae bacterium]